ncbi:MULTISPECIES: homocitrate synthase family protein [unclassified Acidiplasma]|uniref:homocitrate synthase family protein n=1 Tax=unclassified Acidiplasma TaxID=2641301 RepID=UPI000A78DEAE|nr:MULTISPECIES: homocitrate synthase family protein [unclassified Acidiplasma]WMT54405.1 MAG: homocitrate synthase family protein [Acidiplasma sp.]
MGYDIDSMDSNAIFNIGMYSREGFSSTGRKITVFDTTLRDGEQSPGIKFSPEEKHKIAYMLEDMGVDIIEAGFPAVSSEEFSIIKSVNSTATRAKICALARCNDGDIYSAINSGVNYIHIFIATSDIHLKNKLKISREEALKKIEHSINIAKDAGLYVEFSAEDATRTDMDFLIRAFKTAEVSGANKVNIPDTVGIMNPISMRNIVSRIKQNIDIPVSVHCHNDFGLATANTIFGVEGGASQVQVTVNGIGERAGNASLEEVVTGLAAFMNAKTNIDFSKIYNISQAVSRFSGMEIQKNKAIVGENAFSHEAGIHVNGIINSPATYEAINPEFVGRQRTIVIGKHSGRSSIEWILNKNGIKCSEDEVKYILEEIKSYNGKEAFDEDRVINLARNIIKIRGD